MKFIFEESHFEGTLVKENKDYSLYCIDGRCPVAGALYPYLKTIFPDMKPEEYSIEKTYIVTDTHGNPICDDNGCIN